MSAHPALLGHDPRLPARHAGRRGGDGGGEVGGREGVEGLHGGLPGLGVRHSLPGLHQSLRRLLKEGRTVSNQPHRQ